MTKVLRTPKEAAERLHTSVEQLTAFVRDGELKYINLGRGKKRPRRMFTDEDLDEFIERRTRKERAVSLYKPAKSPYWQFDFEIGGHRFYGSTKCKNRREAEAVERAEREKAERHVKQAKAAATSLRLDDVAGRYWQEVGQHHVGADNTERQIGYLIDFFGKDKLIIEITGDDVAKLVAWRRGHRTRSGALISPFTANDTTEQLKKIFTRAKAWGVHFDREPEWRKYWLKEPQERVRELLDDEANGLMRQCARITRRSLRSRTPPACDCANACCAGRKSIGVPARSESSARAVSWSRSPITPTIREILWPLRGHHPEFVFTYVAQRTRDGRVKDERHPLTKHGVKTAWRRLRKRAGVTGFRFHDFRHDFASKLLRETGNLKLVQRALNHADLKTTSRYAHVLDEDVAAAMERVTSQKKPRTAPRKVS